MAGMLKSTKRAVLLNLIYMMVLSGYMRHWWRFANAIEKMPSMQKNEKIGLLIYAISFGCNIESTKRMVLLTLTCMIALSRSIRYWLYEKEEKKPWCDVKKEEKKTLIIVFTGVGGQNITTMK